MGYWNNHSMGGDTPLDIQLTCIAFLYKNKEKLEKVFREKDIDRFRELVEKDLSSAIREYIPKEEEVTQLMFPLVFTLMETLCIVNDEKFFDFYKELLGDGGAERRGYRDPFTEISDIVTLLPWLGERMENANPKCQIFIKKNDDNGDLDLDLPSWDGFIRILNNRAYNRLFGEETDRAYVGFLRRSQIDNSKPIFENLKDSEQDSVVRLGQFTSMLNNGLINVDGFFFCPLNEKEVKDIDFSILLSQVKG